MLGRTAHVIQIITLTFIRIALQQQINEADDRRKRCPDVMADCQNQVLTATQQIFRVLFGFLQLLPVIMAARNIPDDDD